MKIYKNFDISRSNCGFKTTVTLGTFDGVHIGHREILKKVIDRAEQSGEQSSVVTFDRHPSTVLKPDLSPNLLSTLDEKLSLFETIGIDITFVISFTKQIAEMNAEQFMKEYLITCLGMSHFIVGYDHGFGKERKGTSDILRELAHKYNFILEILKPVTYNGMVVNSSIIRSYLSEGKVDSASVLLGTDYSLRGYVISGHGLGRKIGIPTANIMINDPKKIIPLSGVYAGWLEFEGTKRESVLCLGSRPTFNREEEAIEVHIPEFGGNLYGKEVKVGFSQRLRDIEKFESQQALVQQIKKDIETLKQLVLL